MKLFNQFTLAITLVLLLFGTPAIGQLSNPSSGESSNAKKVLEKRVTIHSVRGNRITVSEASSGGRGRRGGFGNSTATASGALGRGRRGRAMSGQSTITPSSGGKSTRQVSLLVPDNAVLTYAMTERRTNEFKVGTSINGRLRNSIFRNIPPQGLAGRIVLDGNRLIELNIIRANDTSLEAIAVKPKRPPRRK